MIDAAIVWMDVAQDAPPPATPEELLRWADARGLHLVLPTPAGRKTIPLDPTIVTRVEEDLRATHELLTQHDADGTERALARAEQLLRDHPELPQAAWLMAEVERGWASRWARLDPPDAARAARAWRAAAALDGGRASGVGEPSSDADGTVAFALAVEHDGRGELRLDGATVQPGTNEARPGLHQLVAKADGAVVFASWITVAAGTTVRVALPTATPCSRDDLARASLGTAGVQCPSWVAVRHDGEAHARFRVRACEGAQCGPELVLGSLEPVGPGHGHGHGHGGDGAGLPKWLTWTLVGAGVVAVGVAAAYTAWWLATPYGQVTAWKQGSTDAK